MKRSEEEWKKRQKMIDAIEGQVGIFKAIWNEWPTEEIETLWDYVTVPAGAPRK